MQFLVSICYICPKLPEKIPSLHPWKLFRGATGKFERIIEWTIIELKNDYFTKYFDKEDDEGKPGGEKRERERERDI